MADFSQETCVLKHKNIDDRLDSIDDSLKEIKESLNEMNVTSVKQQIILEEHIRRTNLLELKMEPIERKIYWGEGSLKLLGILSLLAGIIAAFAKAI